MKISIVAVGTRGDVEPHMALGCELMRRGYDVRLAAPLDFERQATQFGFDFHPIQTRFLGLLQSDGGAALLDSGNRSFRFMLELRKLATSVAGQIVDDVERACRGSDAVCYSLLGMPAHYFAKQLGIPSFPTSFQPMGRTRSHPPPLFSGRVRLPGAVNRLMYVTLEQAFWQFFRPLLNKAAGIASPFSGHFGDLYRQDKPMLFAYSPCLVPRPGDFKPWMHVTGFWSMPPDPTWQPSPALADFLASGPPPVCVGFGSMESKRVEKILDATLRTLAAMGKRAIVLTGWWTKNVGMPSSENDVYVTDQIPHDWLFPQVSSVIHHGGAGTTAAALRAGIPSVILPFFFDQAFWGQWVHRIGLGPAPIFFSGMNERSLRAALEEAEKSAPLRRRVRDMGRSLGGEDGIGNAANILDRALKG